LLKNDSRLNGGLAEKLSIGKLEIRYV